LARPLAVTVGYEVLGLDEVLEKIGENNSIKAVATPYRERAFEEIKEACSVEVVVGLFGGRQGKSDRNSGGWKLLRLFGKAQAKP
jgi:hypothetical protein